MSARALHAPPAGRDTKSLYSSMNIELVIGGVDGVGLSLIGDYDYIDCRSCWGHQEILCLIHIFRFEYFNARIDN